MDRLDDVLRVDLRDDLAGVDLEVVEVEEVEEAEEACPFTVALAAPLAALWIGASRSAAATRLALLDAAWARSAA